MERLRLNIDPFANDHGRWGASLANNAEIMFPALEAAGVTSVGEVGAYAGDLTRLLLEWAAQRDATVWAIDPLPQAPLRELAENRPDLEIVKATSVEALQTIPLPDAIILDGDHNYFTVTEELRIIAERSAGGRLPLLLFHDVCWPHARRDDYYDPEQIPAEHRQPYAHGGGLHPTEKGLYDGGLPYRYPAKEEGGPRNGVLTAVEDFAEEHGLTLAVIPSFFGLGLVYDPQAPYADALAEVLAPYDRNPLMQRLEANRVHHLATVHVQMVAASRAQQRVHELEAVLYKLLESGTFSVAEKLSSIRQGGTPAFSKEEIRRVLQGEGQGS